MGQIWNWSTDLSDPKAQSFSTHHVASLAVSWPRMPKSLMIETHTHTHTHTLYPLKFFHLSYTKIIYVSRPQKMVLLIWVTLIWDFFLYWMSVIFFVIMFSQLAKLMCQFLIIGSPWKFPEIMCWKEAFWDWKESVAIDDKELTCQGTSLAGQWLRLYAPNAVGRGSLVRELDPTCSN